MGRWRADPEAAADALGVDAVALLEVASNTLLVDPGPRTLAEARSAGIRFEVWTRRLGGQVAPAADPPAGPFASAVIRLPKSKAEWAMRAAQAGAVVHGPIFVVGGNDEGVRSAGNAVADTFSDVSTVAKGGHGRILRLHGSKAISSARSSRGWRIERMIDWPGGRARPWITYPGLFADGELDAGTRLLLVSLEQLPNPGRVLDYGCGTGVIARAVLDANPTSEVEAMDIDVLALAALVENAPTAKPLLGDRLPANTTWNRIVSNPPIHVGVREDHTALTRLIETAPTHLTKGGDFVVVVQRRLPLDTQLAASFSKVEILADDGRYRVWRATH